jgi:hypothetical protein
MLLKISATRTPQGALKFVALIIKILSCNKNLFFHGLWSKLPQLFYFSREAKSKNFQKSLNFPKSQNKAKIGQRFWIFFGFLGKKLFSRERSSTGSNDCFVLVLVLVLVVVGI